MKIHSCLKFIVIILILFFAAACDSGASPAEFRGVWLTNVDSEVLDSKEDIDKAMEFLAKQGFNVVMPVVWNDAYTLYPSRVMDNLFQRSISPRFAGRDPLKELIDAAHANGLKVIAWFEYGFAASYRKNGGALLEKRPEWAALDIEGNLLTKNGFEWMNAYHPEVQDLLLKLILEVVNHYDIDGVQGDDRLPAQPVHGGYSQYTTDLYRSEHGGNPPPDDFRDPEWMRWRADKLNAFAERIYGEVKAADPEVLVTWAPSVYPWCYEEYLQDWPSWAEGGYADMIIPQVYRYDTTLYENTLRSQNIHELAPENTGTALIPGVLLNVGSYLMPAEMLKKTVTLNRQLGYEGEIFFFYEGLRKEDDRNAEILRDLYQGRVYEK